MSCQQVMNQKNSEFNENVKKISKMKFGIISNYGYLHLKDSIRNFTLDYHN